MNDGSSSLFCDLTVQTYVLVCIVHRCQRFVTCLVGESDKVHQLKALPQGVSKKRSEPLLLPVDPVRNFEAEVRETLGEVSSVSLHCHWRHCTGSDVLSTPTNCSGRTHFTSRCAAAVLPYLPVCVFCFDLGQINDTGRLRGLELPLYHNLRISGWQV